MKIIEGNITDIDLLLEHGVTALGHGANVRSTMGAGVALQIKKSFPQMYDVDVEFDYEPLERFGKYTMAYIDTLSETGSKRIVGVNFYQQDLYGDGLILEALLKAIGSFVWENHYRKITLALPWMIGCGLAGGNWDEVRPAVEGLLESLRVELIWVKYNG